MNSDLDYKIKEIDAVAKMMKLTAENEEMVIKDRDEKIAVLKKENKELKKIIKAIYKKSAETLKKYGDRELINDLLLKEERRKLAEYS